MTRSKRSKSLSNLPRDWILPSDSTTNTRRNSRRRSLPALSLFSPASEDQIQAACVEWFRHAHPSKAGLLFSIPNGARTSFSVARRLVKTGLVKGVPDLFLAVANKTNHGLFIEMKKSGAYAKPHQREKMNELREQGYFVDICKSVDDFISLVQAYLAS